MDIQRIPAAETYFLRQSILRPSQPLEASHYPFDDIALHFGAFLGERLVGVITAHPEEKKDFNFFGQYRIRGMAVAADCQGQGIGQELVRRMFEEFRAQKIPFVWCNARERAIPFYENLGFKILGGLFTLPEIGPHKVMYCEIAL